MIDLYNGEIVGHSCRKYKDSTIVKEAFSSISFPLYDIEIFHTDRGSEFKNAAIDETLRTFQIQHSLSRKGCPHDNAVAEATMKIIKTEFANKAFDSFTTLERELNDYVNWYNNFRRHSRNGNKPPAVAA
jgi:transposase InsO family protein